MSSVVISGDTSGQVTLAAPSVAGSNTITLQAATGTLALQSDGLGFSQTWTDLTASRVLSTTYTNSTGRPIAISVYWQATSLGTATATVGGLQIAATAIAASAASNSGGLSFVVPVGATYSVACNVSFTRWAELR
jgi:hypothetical protein